MANFFKHFPKTYYVASNNNIEVYATNLTRTFAFDEQFKTTSSVFYEYDVQDGETPEIVAHKFYGNPEYHWILLSYNSIMHPQFDWVLSSSSLIDFIDAKYLGEADTANNETGLEWAQTNTKDYILTERKTNLNTNEYDEEIIYLNSSTYANTINSTENYTLSDGTSIEVKKTKSTKSYYDYENEINESKRSIKILKREFVDNVFEEFKNTI
jgi:hypothetical protein